MEKTGRRGNGKRSLESTDVSAACEKNRRKRGPEESDYPIVIKEENDTDDPLYLSVVDDPEIRNVIKEEFEEEDTVLQKQVEKETSSETNLQGHFKSEEEGLHPFTTEDTSKVQLVGTENTAPSSLKNKLSPELVVYPLTTDGCLQVESGTSNSRNKNVTKKSNTDSILKARKPVTRTTAFRRAPQRLQPDSTSSEEEESEEYDEEFDLQLTKKVRGRKKKQLKRDVELWTNSDSSMRTLKFTRTRSWLMPRTNQAAAYFNYFYGDNYLQGIVDATNKEALSKKDCKYDIVHLRGWTTVTVSELKIFLGLLLHTGTAKMSYLGDYWRQHRLFKSCFRDYMTPQRFTAIMRYLTIPECNADGDRITERFNSVMEKIYYPGRNLNLDATIVDLRTLKSIYGQHQNWIDKINDARITTLCEQDGMTIYIMIGTPLRKAPDMASSIFNILNGKLDGGHSLNVSNAVMITPDLAGRLLVRKTYCTAVNIGSIPMQLLDHEVEPGQNRSLFRMGVHMAKYNSGSANVYYLTTEYKDEMKQSKSCQFTEPVAISSHEERYKSIERFNLIEYYPCEMHKLPRMKKIFIHCLMLSLLNANLLYNAFSGATLNFVNYRLKVIEDLLPEIEVGSQLPQVTQEKRVKTQSRGVNTQAKAIGTPRESSANLLHGKPHKMSKIPKSKNRVSEDGRVVKATARRQCRNCKIVKNIRKNCIYECAGCRGSPALCLQCFFEIHKVTV